MLRWPLRWTLLVLVALPLVFMGALAAVLNLPALDDTRRSVAVSLLEEALNREVTVAGPVDVILGHSLELSVRGVASVAPLAAHSDSRGTTSNIADLYRKKVMELQTLLADETARPQAMDIIRTMIERIEVHQGPERGTPHVIRVGALGQILGFSQQTKTAASQGDGGRVLMVAGARKQRESLILPVRL